MLKCALVALVLVVSTLDASAGSNARSARKAARSKKAAKSAQAFSKVCSTVRNVSGREFLYKSEISHHISPGDVRSAGPTLICNRVCPQSWPAQLFSKSGTTLGKLGVYGRWNVTGKLRAYCGAGGAPACSNSTITRKVRARGEDGWVYLQTSRARTGKKTVCYRVRPTGRTGNPT